MCAPSVVPPRAPSGAPSFFRFFARSAARFGKTRRPCPDRFRGRHKNETLSMATSHAKSLAHWLSANDGARRSTPGLLTPSDQLLPFSFVHATTFFSKRQEGGNKTGSKRQDKVGHAVHHPRRMKEGSPAGGRFLGCTTLGKSCPRWCTFCQRVVQEMPREPDSLN